MHSIPREEWRLILQVILPWLDYLDVMPSNVSGTNFFVVKLVTQFIPVAINPYKIACLRDEPKCELDGVCGRFHPNQ